VTTTCLQRPISLIKCSLSDKSSKLIAVLAIVFACHCCFCCCYTLLLLMMLLLLYIAALSVFVACHCCCLCSGLLLWLVAIVVVAHYCFGCCYNIYIINNRTSWSATPSIHPLWHACLIKHHHWALRLAFYAIHSGMILLESSKRWCHAIVSTSMVIASPLVAKISL